MLGHSEWTRWVRAPDNRQSLRLQYSLIFRHKDIIVSELLMTGIHSFYHDNLVIRHLNIKYSVPLHMRKVKKTSALP